MTSSEHADRTVQLLMAYLAGEAELEPVAEALARLHGADGGWSLYLDPGDGTPEQRARADALVARYGELTARSWRAAARRGSRPGRRAP